MLNWVLGDHYGAQRSTPVAQRRGPGSASVTANADGSWNSEIEYCEASPKQSAGDTAFGEVRDSSGLTPTEYRYTGQMEAAELGLYFYVARWYDPYLNHFIQADTLVPGVGDTKAFDRYAYTVNNPIYYSDPTGHWMFSDVDSYGNIPDYNNDWKEQRLRTEMENFTPPERIREEEEVNYLGQSIAPEEKDLLDKYGNGIWVGVISNHAINKVEDIFGEGDSGYCTPGDAWRHAYWSARLTKAYGEDFAVSFTTAHETESSSQWDADQQAFMDLHNNRVGINIALENPNASNKDLQELVLAALISGQLVVWDRIDIYYSDQCPACNY